MPPRPAQLGSVRYVSSTFIKFRRQGAVRDGITLSEAMAGVRLTEDGSYTSRDLNVGEGGTIALKIKWSGHRSMTYDIPVDEDEGSVQMQLLGRRIARACVHFFQMNIIPVSWDRVVLYHLEEIQTGVWQPIISTGD